MEEKDFQNEMTEKNKEEKKANSDLKERMQKVINASKKLDNDLMTEDPKKQAMKEKLAKAAKQVEDDLEENEPLNQTEDLSDEELIAKKKAQYYANKNLETKKKLEEMRAKLNMAMNEADNDVIVEEESLETQQENNDFVSEVNEEKIFVEENKLEKEETVEEAAIRDLETSSAIVKNIVDEYNKEEKAKDEEVKEDYSKITNDLKEELPELKEQKVKSKVWSNILDFIIKTMNGMAHGLFATLIIGTIISTIAGFFNTETQVYTVLNSLGTILKDLTGAGIGLGVAGSLGFKDLKLISLGVAGAITSWFCYSAAVTANGFAFQIGDPLTIYLVVVAVSLLMKYILVKKTPVDIIIVPLFASILACLFTVLISKYTVLITTLIGKFIGVATEYQPILMGIVIAVVMGMALTAPISSAAIAATIFTQAALAENEFVAIAGGAALIGCCCQMVGFAIQSRKDNGIGTVFAIGIGTSMLQFKNILKKPIIWLPTIIASAILGPISTTVIKMKCMGTACGMGTSGLVGQIGSIDSLYGLGDYRTWLVLIGFQVVLPIILVFFIDLLFRKLKWIKEGDLKL